MHTYYLAVDIGASSGRHILGHVENGILVQEEIFRFPNEAYGKGGHFYWDIQGLFNSIIEGMKVCRRLNKIPESMAIDTWGVDYVLLDENDTPLHDPFSYRDPRTRQGVEKVHARISQEQLYQQSGIQFQPFNTIYQLACEENLAQAKDMLMIPDYLNYLLTGIKANEYTNFSTTQMLDTSGHLNLELLHTLEIDADLFAEIKEPGSLLGHLSREVQQMVGFDTQVILAASHDTGSAYMASIKPGIVLSSGTWSLIGANISEVQVSIPAREANFTSEGGYQHEIRFLKNIMGLWIIQEVARNLNGRYSFAQLVDLARTSCYNEVFDTGDARFLKPVNMMQEISCWMAAHHKPLPQSVGDYARSVYLSLAGDIARAAEELDELLGTRHASINILGGGSKNELLNQMIADASKKTVYAGPVEATALGNLMAQLIAAKECTDLADARALVARSEAIRTFTAHNSKLQPLSSAGEELYQESMGEF